MSTAFNKKIGRLLVAVTAIAVIFTTTGVTAFAAVADNITVTTSSGDDSLTVILPHSQSQELAEAVLATLSASDREKVVNGTPLAITLSAQLLENAPDAMALAASLLGDKQPELMFSLSLSRQLEGGSKKSIATLDRRISLTVALPPSLVGERCSVVTANVELVTAAVDSDNVPNTITFAVDSIATVMVVRGELSAVTAPPAPTTTDFDAPAAKPSNPKAGGIDDAYLPRSILAQAVPISMPITVGTTASFCESMAGTSMLMTAAFVGGTIDFENSEQEDEEQEGSNEQETGSETQYDEDIEDIEDYVDSFDKSEHSYRADLGQDDSDNELYDINKE